MVSAKAVPPGGETSIKATLKTYNRRGPLKKTVTVISNDPDNPRLVLTLQGEIITDIILDPISIWLGQLPLRKSAESEFSAVSRDPNRIKIISVKVNHKSFQIKPVFKDTSKGKYKLIFTGGNQLGSISTNIEVTYQAVDKKSINLPVRALVIGDLVYTKYIRFMRRDNKFDPKDVVFSTRSGKPVRLKSAVDPNGLLKLTIDNSNKPHPTVRAVVKNPNESYKRPKRYNFKLRTTNKDEPEVEIGYTIMESPNRPNKKRTAPTNTTPLNQSQQNVQPGYRKSTAVTDPGRKRNITPKTAK